MQEEECQTRFERVCDQAQPTYGGASSAGSGYGSPASEGYGAAQSPVCRNVPRQECRTVPRQSCRPVPQQECRSADTTYQSYMSYILVKIFIYSHIWTNHTSHIISYCIKLFEGAFHVSSAAMFPGRSVTRSPDRSVVYNDKKGVNEGIHQTVKT